MRLGDCGEHRVRLRTAPAQQRYRGDVPGPVFSTLPGHRGQHTVGAELQEGRHALVEQVPDTVVEAHGVAHVPNPVLRGADPVGGDRPAGEVGDDRDRRLVQHEAVEHLAERGEHAVHAGGVEGVTDGQPLRPAALRAQPLGDPRDGFLLAGDHDGAGSVDGGDAGLADAAGQQGGHLLLRRLHRHHRAAGGELLHQAAAGGHRRDRVLQREHPGDVGRRKLPDRVAEHEVRPQSPGFDQPEQCHLQREQGRLGEGRFVQPVRLR